MKIETAAARASHHIDPESGAILAPIQPSTTFERSEDGEYPSGYIYSRSGNPNRRQLEDILATLEGGAACAAFSSGSAASAAVFQALESGDHVVAPNDCYHGTAALLRDVFARWGLQITFTDVTDSEQVQQAMQPNTRLVWVETPSNPMLKVTDIRRTATIAHEAGALCVCDNTWATPMIQQPIGLGADAVVHSTTKYLSGHSDVMGGAVIAASDDAFFDKVRRVQATYGAVPSAFDCWLTLRGIRTLHLRMRAHSENARAVIGLPERASPCASRPLPRTWHRKRRKQSHRRRCRTSVACFRFRLWADGNRLWRLLPNCGCSLAPQVWAAPRA